MRLRLVKHPQYSWHGFLIGNKENYILVIPYGSNIFGYLDVLNREILKQSKRIKQKDIHIFLDLLHIPGNEEKKKRFLKVIYKKDSNWIDWLAGKNVFFEELPEFFQEEIRKAYTKYKDRIVGLPLSTEKEKFQKIIS